MQSLDIKYYLSVFWRRFPYFLIIAVFISAIGLTVASILPPTYRSTATILVEAPQIPDELAQSTVPVNPVETIQIIQQRMMTRANLLDIANRFGIYADEEGMTADDVVEDMTSRTSFNTELPIRNGRPIPGATFIYVSFDAERPTLAAEVTNEITTLILQESVQLRTGRATDTLQFFEQEVDRLADELDRTASQILAFKRDNQDALPESLEFRRNTQTLNQERLLQLEREEAALRDTRNRVVSIYEQTGRVISNRDLSSEEQELAGLRRQLEQARAVYSETSPNVTMLKNRIAALEPVVAEQLEVLNPEFAGMSEYDIQLAELDGQLEFIAAEKARIDEQLAALDATIRATPANEMALRALERDQTNFQDQYNTAVARLRQADVGERIEVMAKGERFSLVEQATPPEDPSTPNRLMIGGGSIAAGLGAGLGFIVLLELLNRSIRRPGELSSKLGIEPFATIPYIRTRREIAWKRGIVVSILLLIAVAIPAGLFAVHTYYLPLELVFRNMTADIGLNGL